MKKVSAINKESFLAYLLIFLKVSYEKLQN